MRQSTWANIGTDATTNNAVELLESAGLNYTAIMRDAYVPSGTGEMIQIPNKKVVLRSDTEEIFGIVSDKYQICQNKDALDFVDYIDGIELVKAGGVSGYTWMIGRLPEMTVLGDSVRPHLIFQNSHDGGCSIKSTICMLRIVCQNQFVGAFKNSPATISLKHQGDLNSKLIVARETLSNVYEYAKNYSEVAEDLATKKITPTKFDQIVETFFAIPEDASTRTENKIIERRERFRQAYQVEDNQNFVGTKWGLVNAYSDLITHEDYSRKTQGWETNRFYGSMNPTIMTEFMKVVEAA